MTKKEKADKKFHKVLKEYSEGKLKSQGKKVTNDKQALAIAFSEARKIYENYGAKKYEKEKGKFETGATSREVNDLILFTDNTENLSVRIYKIYNLAKRNLEFQSDELINQMLFEDFIKISTDAEREYLIETKEKIKLTPNQRTEFANHYVKYFKQWLKENKSTIHPELPKYMMNERGVKIENETAKNGGKAKGKFHTDGGMKGIIIETGRPIEFENEELILTKGVSRIKQHVKCKGTPEGIASRLNEMGNGNKISDDSGECEIIKTEKMENDKKLSNRDIEKKQNSIAEEITNIYKKNNIKEEFIPLPGSFGDVEFSDKSFVELKNKNENDAKKVSTLLKKYDKLDKQWNEDEMNRGSKIKSHIDEKKNEKIQRMIIRNNELKQADKMENGAKIEPQDVLIKINEPQNFAILCFLKDKNFDKQKVFKYNDICIYKSSEDLIRFLDVQDLHYTEFESHEEFYDWLKKLLPSRLKK